MKTKDFKLYLNIVLKRSKKHFIFLTAKSIYEGSTHYYGIFGIDNTMMSDGHFIMDQNSTALIHGLNNADK